MSVTTSGLGGPNAGASIREDLIKFITNIDRDETPFLSSLGTKQATAIAHEWNTDEYGAPIDTDVTEGAPYAASSVVFQNRLRKSNYNQIFRRELGVSGSADAVNTDHGGSEYAYQMKKNAVQLKRIIERQYVRFQATGAPTQTVKSGSDPRKTGSIFTWVKTVYRPNPSTGTAINVAPTPSSGTAGTNLTFTNSVGIVPDASLDGDNVIRNIAAFANTVALSRTHVEGLLAAMYEQGAKPDMAMMSPALKVRFSQVFSDAATGTVGQRRMEALEMKIATAVTAFMTDFGFSLAAMPNYQMGSGANSAGFDGGVLFYESDKVNRAFLRDYRHIPLDDQGDGRRGILICEEALEVLNPRAVGMILGISAS